MAVLWFQVSGMRSRRCVRVISARVSDVAGVSTVAVDLAAGTVQVTGTAELSAVGQAISRAGYAAVALPLDPIADTARGEHRSAGHRMEEGEGWTAR